MIDFEHMYLRSVQKFLEFFTQLVCKGSIVAVKVLGTYVLGILECRGIRRSRISRTTGSSGPIRPIETIIIVGATVSAVAGISGRPGRTLFKNLLISDFHRLKVIKLFGVGYLAIIQLRGYICENPRGLITTIKCVESFFVPGVDP